MYVHQAAPLPTERQVLMPANHSNPRYNYGLHTVRLVLRGPGAIPTGEKVSDVLRKAGGLPQNCLNVPQKRPSSSETLAP